MKAITIKQPWASLIVEGIKDIENRTWKTNFRGKVLIHASAQYAAKELQSLISYEQWGKIPEDLQCDFVLGVWVKSAIIGEVDIIDCVINHSSIWAEKTYQYQLSPEETNEDYPKPIYNWVLANPVIYDKPILNVKGKLSFWEYEN